MNWSIGREDTPGWAFVWERLVEHRRNLPSDLSSDRVFRTGAEWLDGREDEPGWSFVWEFLVKHREALPDDIDAEQLLRAGARWAQRHPDHRYAPTLVLKLLTTAPRFAEWLDELAGQLAGLGEHAATLGGAQMIHTLAKQDFRFDFPRGADAAGPGWMHLIEVVQAYTLLRRRFLDNHEQGETVAGTIGTRVKNGYIIQLLNEGAGMAFLPRTNAVRPPSGDWDALVGTDAQFKIFKLDRTSGNIIVTQSASSAWDVPDNLAVGQVMEGSIAEIGDYYLSVDVGGVAGRLHKDHLIDRSMGDLRVCEFIDCHIRKPMRG